jgi:hypothetical protein
VSSATEQTSRLRRASSPWRSTFTGTACNEAAALDALRRIAAFLHTRLQPWRA